MACKACVISKADRIEELNYHLKMLIGDNSRAPLASIHPFARPSFDSITDNIIKIMNEKCPECDSEETKKLKEIEYLKLLETRNER